MDKNFSHTSPSLSKTSFSTPEKPFLGVLDLWEGPAIALVDLDSFFAAVEQLDHPGWRGKPVIVGGNADKRGVVSTASYEARAYGVRSAMPSSTARSLCPDAIWTPGNHERYRQMSQEVMRLLRKETPFVQQVSIDEAFIDITPNLHNTEHPIVVAKRIQESIEALGISASIGLGTSKTIAKIASDTDKPRGITVVHPGREKDFLSPLPVRTLSGIGPSTEKELRRHGIETLGDIAGCKESFLKQHFGKNGRTMFIRANGKDDSPIELEEEVKSVSNEITFAEDLTSQEDVEAALATMAAKVGRRLRRKGLAGHTLSLKIRYDDRSTKNVQRRLEQNTNDDLFYTPLLFAMVREVWRPGIPVRLLGVGMSGFDEESYRQEQLFETEEDQIAIQEDPLIKSEKKREDLLHAADRVRDKFGEQAVQFGHEIKTAQRTTGSGSKNPADYK